MKLCYFIFILSVISGCTSPKNDSTEILDSPPYRDTVSYSSSEILDFPPYSDTISYSGCEEILEKTPSAEGLIIFSDSIINFRNIDSRVPLKLKFNWVYEEMNSIGVESFEIIKDNQSIDKIDLEDLINLEATDYIKENGEVKNIPNKTIYLTDLNLDSFLDIGMTEGCGKSCHNIYWIYDPIKQTFQRAHKSYNFIRPIKYECLDDKTILYSYADGMAWYVLYHADIIREDSLEFYQSKEFNAGYKEEKYNLLIYKNAIGDTIKIDTLPKN